MSAMGDLDPPIMKPGSGGSSDWRHCNVCMKPLPARPVPSRRDRGAMSCSEECADKIPFMRNPRSGFDPRGLE